MSTIRPRSIVAILASSQDNTIGDNNTIPWRCRTDMLFFKKTTTGNVIIMGRKTFESMNSTPLSNRVNIVISTTLKQADVTHDDLYVVDSVMKAILLAKKVELTKFTRNTVSEHIFIVGGVELYESTIIIVDEVLHSKIDIHCGSPRYGSSFIKGPLDKCFTSNIAVTNEVIYYNPGIVPTPDKHKLEEIIHMYYNTAEEPLQFKEDVA